LKKKFDKKLYRQTEEDEECPTFKTEESRKGKEEKSSAITWFRCCKSSLKYLLNFSKERSCCICSERIENELEMD